MTVTQVRLCDIRPAAWNARTSHAVDAIAESISVNGFRDPIEVWRQTGEIVAGEGRYLAALALGMDTVPVIWHEFDSLLDAQRYHIANNRLTDRSEWKLDELKQQLEQLGTLEGTGFDAFALHPVEPANDPDEEYVGMPRGDNEDLMPARQITVSFETEDDVQEFARVTGQPLTPRTKSMWYPPKPRRRHDSEWVTGNDES